ncbi:hypothetical protein DXT99_24550 [Pontibacter diazotrophicus]|uniref:Uncharacterized protein n=2 Tax=Pontibacter diazotrophicus TaxID=1400979 RepID=A0A3D8L2B2_9BACT|nr:hypothetical protein DXT99_24550 [Pontibacter diazotrophicus]
MLHLFNYSINMEDHRLWTGMSVSEEYNEIETFAELTLTLLFQEDGALPDEANDIDETKAAAGIIAVMPAAFSFNSQVFAFREPTTFQDYRNGYLNLVYDICPPPPKAQV